MLNFRLKKLSDSNGFTTFSSHERGFTLIELLIVIAVLGVLAAVILVAINPLEQIARGKDSGIKNDISQIGHSTQSYYTSQQILPAVNATWQTSLQTSGDLKTPATVPAGANNPTCTGGGLQNGFCYLTDGLATPLNFVIYANLQSAAEKNKGTCGGLQANTWYVYSSADGRAGTYCGTEANIKTTAQTAPYTFGVNLLP